MTGWNTFSSAFPRAYSKECRMKSNELNTDFERWIGTLINEKTPQLILCGEKTERVANNLEPDSGCLINSPEYQMKNELLSFNVSEASNLILFVAGKVPDPRLKPLVATVRGTGTGKSRCLEEIRRNLLQKDHVLPIAVTFNCDTNFLLSQESWDFSSNQIQRYAFSVIARIIFSFFGVGQFRDFATLLNLMHESLRCYDTSSWTVDEIIRKTVQMLTSVTIKRRPCINTFILIIDESVKLEEAILGVGSGNGEIWDRIRGALLNKPIMVNGEVALNVALVMSSLNVSPLGVTDSGRIITPLILPAKLEPGDIVLKWWKKKSSAQDRKSEDVLLLCAAMVSSLPRLISFANDFLERWNDKRIDSDFVKAFIEDMSKCLLIVYPKMKLPSLELLDAAIFRRKVILDINSMKAIRASTLTNSLEGFELNETELIPEISLANLFARRLDGDGDVLAKSYLGTKAAFMQELTASSSSRNYREGFLLESVIGSILQLRIVLIRKWPVRSVSLSTLLGIERLVDDWNDGTVLKTLLQTILDFGKVAGSRPVHKMMSSTRATEERGYSEFVKELDEVEVSSMNQLAILYSRKGDAWDICLKFHRAQNTAAYVFLECKSKRETFESISSTDLKLKQIAGQREQYKHCQKVFDGTNFDFAFIYLTTHEGSPIFQNDNSFLVLDRATTFNFLGPFVDLYRVARCVVTNDDNSQ